MFEGKTPPAELEKYQWNEDSNEPEIQQLSAISLKKSLSSYFKIIYFLMEVHFIGVRGSVVLQYKMSISVFST